MGGYQAAAAFRLLELGGGGVWGYLFYGGRLLAEGTSPALRAASPFQGEAKRGGRAKMKSPHFGGFCLFYTWMPVTCSKVR